MQDEGEMQDGDDVQDKGRSVDVAGVGRRGPDPRQGTLAGVVAGDDIQMRRRMGFRRRRSAAAVIAQL